MIKLDNNWENLLKEESQKDYFIKLNKFLDKEYLNHKIYPSREDIFNAFLITPFSNVKVVILGQDPYHEEGQAHGLAFSVKKGVKIPPSLRNIYKELHSDIGFKIPSHGCLEDWGKEGVLLLNTVLTVRDGAANSHKNMGWEIFTNKVIEYLNMREEPIVFILWGNNSRSKKTLITNPNHHVIEGPHPSPLSAYRGFFGGKFFTKANSYLDDQVNWTIKE